jgi:hypothetical protein
MKKKIISLIVLVVLFGAALAAYLVLSNTEPEAPPPAASSSAAEVIYVLGGNPQPFVREVKIQNELDTFTIKNNHENAIAMQNADAPDFGIDGLPQEYLLPGLMKTIATNCASLDARQIVSGGEPAAYGLDSPRATVEAVYDDGSATILIGDEAPGGTGTYVSKDGTVYLVTSSKLTNMLFSRYGFVDKVITSGSVEQPAAIVKAVIGGTSVPEPIVIEMPAEQNEQAAAVGVTSYRVTSPIEADADTDRALTALSASQALTATEVVALADENNALADYSLSEPYLTTEVTSEDPAVGTFTLQISEADEEDNVYLRRTDRPFIYKLPVASIPWYGLSLFDYMQKLAVLPFIDEVAEVDVVVEGDMVYTFELEGEGKELAASVNGTTLDTDSFRQFYQTLIFASYDEEIPEGETIPEGEQTVLQFVYRYRNGQEPDTVSFLPGPARRYLIRLNDGPLYYTQSLYVDRVLEDLPKLVAGEAIDSYI